MTRSVNTTHADPVNRCRNCGLPAHADYCPDHLLIAEARRAFAVAQRAGHADVATARTAWTQQLAATAAEAPAPHALHLERTRHPRNAYCWCACGWRSADHASALYAATDGQLHLLEVGQ